MKHRFNTALTLPNLSEDVETITTDQAKAGSSSDNLEVNIQDLTNLMNQLLLG